MVSSSIPHLHKPNYTFLLPPPHLSLSLSLWFVCLMFMKIMMMKGKISRACMNKWRKMGSRVIPCAACDGGYCCQWALWPTANGEKSIPKDVPKGHLVVYVGENSKRFVIKITILNHPLFKALLDQARDEYDFTSTNSKLCIPCDENIFINVVRCASSPVHDRIRRISLCL